MDVNKKMGLRVSSSQGVTLDESKIELNHTLCTFLPDSGSERFYSFQESPPEEIKMIHLTRLERTQAEQDPIWQFLSSAAAPEPGAIFRLQDGMITTMNPGKGGGFLCTYAVGDLTCNFIEIGDRGGRLSGSLQFRVGTHTYKFRSMCPITVRPGITTWASLVFTGRDPKPWIDVVVECTGLIAPLAGLVVSYVELFRDAKSFFV